MANGRTIARGSPRQALGPYGRAYAPTGTYKGYVQFTTRVVPLHPHPRPIYYHTRRVCTHTACIFPGTTEYTEAEPSVPFPTQPKAQPNTGATRNGVTAPPREVSYRGTSLIGKHPPPRTTSGPQAPAYSAGGGGGAVSSWLGTPSTPRPPAQVSAELRPPPSLSRSLALSLSLSHSHTHTHTHTHTTQVLAELRGCPGSATDPGSA